jgi:asparagine synthase (glutamine-hydrolysing)
VCGIAGIMGRVGQPADAEILADMASAMIHRGPDDDGYVLEGNIGLAFRRLSIIDVQGGHQPLCNEDQTVWIVFNGEIYNYVELRARLVQRGHVFATETDTEVIVHLYEEYGYDCVHHLRGMFAFAIWDARRDQLFLARDPFGIKPLYYALTSDWFAFASELKSIVRVPGLPRAIDHQSFWHYLTFQYVPDPHSMLQDVHKVPPAHYLLVNREAATLTRYQTLEFQPDSRSLQEHVDSTLVALRESVQAHMVSDVPRGAFLSSGVDSTAIVALMREREEVQTFTVGFEGAGAQSELAIARETAQALGTLHRDTLITPGQYWLELPRLVYQQDDPVADPSAIALHFVARLASEYVTVVLSGEGADELFGGYAIYREPLSLALFERIPPSLRRTCVEVAQLLPYGMKGRSFMQRGGTPIEERFYGNAFLFDEEFKKFICTLDRWPLSPQRSASVTQPLWEQTRSQDDVTRMQHIDLHTWLPGDILAKADRMTMTNSMELRVPFLDREVFAVASGIPFEQRLCGKTTKYVLREAVKGIVPAAIATRPKLGFPVPTREWLRNEHHDAVHELLGTYNLPDLFDRRVALRMLSEHREQIRDYSRLIWALVVFVLWHQAYCGGVRTYRSVQPDQVRRRRKRMASAQQEVGAGQC